MEEVRCGGLDSGRIRRWAVILGCRAAEGGGLGMGRGEARASEGSRGSGHSSGPSVTSCCVSDTLSPSFFQTLSCSLVHCSGLCVCGCPSACPLSVSCVSVALSSPGHCLQCALHTSTRLLAVSPLLAVCCHLHLSASATSCHCRPLLVPVSVTWVSSISAVPIPSPASGLFPAIGVGKGAAALPASGLSHDVSTWPGEWENPQAGGWD